MSMSASFQLPRLVTSLLATTALVSFLSLASPAFAEAGHEAPVWLRADVTTDDNKNQTVTAEGHVEFSQGGDVVRADKLVYDKKSDVITAEGHVTLWSKTGEVAFSDRAVLSRDMTQAFLDHVSILMTDGSRATAAAGERTEGRYTRLDKAVYTACAPCEKNRKKPPIWQIKADRVIHDSQTQDVTYRNATLELGGIPIFYTPILSHPDPSVKQRSGFLAPVIGSRPSLGLTGRSYYYFDIDPSMDATLETSYAAQAGGLLGGEFRRRFDKGEFSIKGSVTQDDIPNDSNPSSTVRGHAFIAGTYDFSPTWRASLDLKRTTDDTYTDLWGYSSDDVLQSSAKLENFHERSYGVVKALSYQDLRSDITSPEPQAFIGRYKAQGKAGATLGGRWETTLETRAVARSGGQDSNRTSVEGSWRREDILPEGVVWTNELSTRVDGFWANDLNNTTDSVTTARPFGQYQTTVSLPFVKVGETGQTFVEPIAQLSLAPIQNRRDTDVPNEDSLGLEFDATNLFSANRYPGYDRVDGGQRVVYGLRSGWSGNSGSSVSGLIGQSYDFSDNPNFPTGSGLEAPHSDVVGGLSAILPDTADLTYGFRLDQATLDPREHDLRATLGPSWLQFSTSYMYIDQPLASGTGADLREELGLGAQWKFASNWTLSGTHTRDLQRSDGALNSSLTMTYQDDCLTFALIGQRDHVARSGLATGDSLFFRLIFKNIGQFESPSFSTTFLPGGKL